jgi:hypothetical protein
MEQIIGSVNTHEDRGVDEEGNHIENTLRGADVVGMTNDQLKNRLAMFADPQQAAIAFENTASNENMGVTPVATYPDHPNMPWMAYANPKRIDYYHALQSGQTEFQA